MPRPVEIVAHIAPNAAEVTRAAAELFARTHGSEAVRTRGIARVAISGGSTPKAMFDLGSPTPASPSSLGPLAADPAHVGRRALRPAHRQPTTPTTA